MSSKVTKLLSILLYVLMAVSTVFIVILMNKTGQVPEELYKTDESMSSWVDFNLTWAYILFGISTGLALLFSVYQTFFGGGNIKNTLIAVGAVVVIYFISNAMASPEIPQFHGTQKLIDEGVLTAGVAKTTDTILYATYILGGLAIAAIVSTPLFRLRK